MTGQWHALLQLTMAQAPEADQKVVQQQDPDQMTIRRLQTAARRGRLGKTWRQLQGFGIAEPCYSTCTKIAEKWSPRKDDLPVPPAPLGRETLRMVFAPEKMNSAVSKLSAGAALDICGWSHETVQSLNAHLMAQNWLTTIAVGLYALSLDSLPWRVMLTSRMIPLNKNQHGDIRPIAVPTMWHKISSAAQAADLLPLIEERLAGHQYGLRQPNGCAALGKAVSQHLQEDPNQVIMQIDVSNAFGTMSRHQLCALLAQFQIPAAESICRWIASSHTAAIALPGQEVYMSSTTCGIPQGDPASAALFCLGAHTVLQTLAQDEEIRHSCDQADGQFAYWCYVDDMTLSMPARAIHLIHEKMSTTSYFT